MSRRELVQTCFIEPGYFASFGPLSFGNFDMREEPGRFVEVPEREPGARELFKTIMDAAQDWDGTDPIRYVT